MNLNPSLITPSNPNQKPPWNPDLKLYAQIIFTHIRPQKSTTTYNGILRLIVVRILEHATVLVNEIQQGHRVHRALQELGNRILHPYWITTILGSSLCFHLRLLLSLQKNQGPGQSTIING